MSSGREALKERHDNNSQKSQDELKKSLAELGLDSFSEKTQFTVYAVEHPDGIYFKKASDNVKAQELIIVRYVQNPPPKFLLDISRMGNGKRDFTFRQLISEVRHLKLPHPAWKILVTTKNNKVDVITITNSYDMERSVRFRADSDYYNITIAYRPAILVASPEKLETKRDLEILLDILNFIDFNDPMIQYE